MAHIGYITPSARDLLYKHLARHGSFWCVVFLHLHKGLAVEHR